MPHLRQEFRHVIFGHFQVVEIIESACRSALQERRFRHAVDVLVPVEDVILDESFLLVIRRAVNGWFGRFRRILQILLRPLVRWIVERLADESVALTTLEEVERHVFRQSAQAVGRWFQRHVTYSALDVDPLDSA